MGYNLKAISIRAAINNMSLANFSISSIPFLDIWNGPAFDNQISALNKLISKFESELEKYESYASALDVLQKYKNNKERISSLYQSLYSLPEEEEYVEERDLIREEITSLENENKQLRESLNNNMAAFAESTIGTELSLVNYTVNPLPTNYETYPHMLQTDYTDIPFSQGTVATSGCGISCSAMIITYYTGEEVTPGYLGVHYNISSLSNAGKMTEALDDYGIHWENNWDGEYDFFQVKEFVDQGHPVIMLMNGGSNFTNSGHFVLVTGINEQGNFIVLDPYAPNYNNPALQEGFENGFTDEQMMQGWSGCWIIESKEDYELNKQE